MRAALDWADAHAIAETCCIIAPENQRSIRLAERLGYRLDREALYKQSKMLVLHRAGSC